MDPVVPRRTRHRRCGGQPRLPNLALIACLFSPVAALAAVALPHPPDHHSPHPAAALEKRIDGEHVVLADCRDQSGTISSQMAYFLSAPGPLPKDVAIVVTTPGQAALWVNGNTTGLFTDTGVRFTSTLGPKVEEGQYAGTGENGYGSFGCWQRYVKGLYTYDQTECSQVYDCEHGAGNSTTGSSSRQDQATGGGGGMSQGTIIGIAVGVGGGLLFAAAAGLVYWFWRRSRRNQHQPEQVQSSTTSDSPWPGSLPSDFTTPVRRMMAPPAEDNAIRPAPGMTQMGAPYEVDGRRFRVEMGNDHGKFEMDAQERAELEGVKWKQEPAMQVGSPTSSVPDSQFDSPVLYDQPPSYRRAVGGQGPLV